MSGVSPPGSGVPQGPAYRPQFKVSPEFRQFWEKLFKGKELSDTEISQMTDQFIKNVWSQMNSVLSESLKRQKEREQERKKEQG